MPDQEYNWLEDVEPLLYYNALGVLSFFFFSRSPCSLFLPHSIFGASDMVVDEDYKVEREGCGGPYRIGRIKQGTRLQKSKP